MELPKRARTAKWENGVLTIDNVKQYQVSNLTMEMMEHLANYNLVGFHVSGYPITDDMIISFKGHKSMVNFGVEYGAITDSCLEMFADMPKLRILLLDGNTSINGINLSVLKDCKLDLLSLNNTNLTDEGLKQASFISKLTHIQIDHTNVTYEGIMAITDNKRIEPVVFDQFTKEQMENFFKIQRQKAKKSLVLDEKSVNECQIILTKFFEDMTIWEQYVEQVGFENEKVQSQLLMIWEKYVSEKPRSGYRPLCLSYNSQGTYKNEEFIDAEHITRNKLYIYTRDKIIGFERRFLMKRVGNSWRIDGLQERLDGWQRVGL